MAGSDLLALSERVNEIHVDETLERYIIALVRATRQHPDIALGASPRGSLALYKASQALAALRGRDHVLPDDIKRLVPITLAHRLIVEPQSQLRARTAPLILRDILEQTPLDIGKLD